jgi:glutamate-5-semialdehyde dehydrogenase
MVSTAMEGIVAANAQDVHKAAQSGMSAAMIDRLTLDASRIEHMAEGLHQVALLEDPVGEITHLKRLENGLQVGQMRVPLGLIAMIYEARPNVTADAAALCIKSGNGCVLRGGSEASESNHAIAACVQYALRAEGLPEHGVSLLPTTDRQAALELIQLAGVVDLVIPRGGEGLIRFVTEHARVPVIQHFKGVCHVYVDGDADLDMAESIVINSKVHRPGVCNAAETLLVDRACGKEFVARVVSALQQHGVQVRGDAQTVAWADNVEPARAEDWDTEYLDKIISVAVVQGMQGAMDHIAQHGTNHTEAIVTASYEKAQRWLREVDASLVLVNASTRFNDGYQLGLGAEIGISTTKMHAYGPMGLRELCTMKWVGLGSGQTRA